ncbi:MAG: hypothetical protein PWQ28_136 [Candidatus Woesearchaeota archaeon]|nr:hypothetical protein [Candidatus Woesearchaeota archaeon]
MELNKSYLFLGDDYAKVVTSKPENESELERYVKKIFSEISKAARSSGEVYITPFSIESPSVHYGIYVEASSESHHKEDIATNEDLQSRVEKYYSSSFKPFKRFKRDYKSLLKPEGKSAFLTDFSYIDDKSSSFRKYMNLLTEGFYYLDNKGINVMLRLSDDGISNPFFIYFYLKNKDNLLTDPSLGVNFFTPDKINVSVENKIKLLLNGFFLNYSDYANSQQSIDEAVKRLFIDKDYAEDLKKANEFFNSFRKDKKERRKEEKDKGLPEKVVISAIAYAGGDSSDELDAADEEAFMVAQLSDLDYKNVSRQIFVEKTFNDIYVNLFSGVIDIIATDLAMLEITPVITDFVHNLCPELPVKSRIALLHYNGPKDKRDVFDPSYVIDSDSLIDSLGDGWDIWFEPDDSGPDEGGYV